MTTKLPTSSKTQEANPDGGRHVFLILGLLAWLILLTSSPAVLAKEHWTDSCLQSPPPELAASSPRGTLILIIDDLGHGRRTGLSMVALPGKINLAILPHTPHAKELAQAGFAAGKEIMLHVPMSNSGGTLLGPGGLTPSLSREEFDRTRTESIDAIPHVRGINNHMGSELTTLPLQMGWVMQALIRRGLYFVDSRTNARTVAAKTAGNYNVPHLSRSIFLDNETSEVAITSQFNHLVKRAEQEGLADIFKEAGFEWRLAGCSMCLAMNPDQLSEGERCASTSNRNFEGRQGYKGRTHLVSPAMAAAAGSLRLRRASTTDCWFAAGWFWLSLAFPIIRSIRISIPTIACSSRSRYSVGASDGFQG